MPHFINPQPINFSSICSTFQTYNSDFSLQGGVVYQSAALYNWIYSLAEVFEPLCPEYLDKSLQTANKLENDPKNEAFQIYPVPNNGEFTLLGALELGYKIQVKSVEGKLVLEETIKEKSETINLKTPLSAGTYTVLLVNEENVVLFNQKILIVR